jgi:hypothetical protein
MSFHERIRIAKGLYLNVGPRGASVGCLVMLLAIPAFLAAAIWFTY